MSRLTPGEGERRAVSGYNPQYRVAAAIILRHLEDRTLRWIRIADPEAGRVDDIQLGTEARVDAYQVKWSQYRDTINYSDLTAASANAPCLIAQLADGWNRLRAIHQASRVVVHLLTSDIASSNTKDHLPTGDPPPTPKHFSAFIEQAWLPRKSGAKPQSAAWDETWKDFEQAAGLTPQEFDEFVGDCELDLNYRLAEEGEDPVQTAQASDMGHIAQFLFDTAASPERVIHLTCEELLRRLGWQQRSELRNPHEFPIVAPYEPIDETVHDLEQKLADLRGGYVLVHGSPGSGKSTLLTEFLLSCSADRVIRYYAYVPDSQEPIALRGESENFLRDIIAMLDDAGIGGRHPASGIRDRSEFLRRFGIMLGQLGEDHRETGRRTLILIDGLDHIEREQRPVRSLLDDLPSPDQVPDGVYLILGSQTDNLQGLGQSVRQAITKPERRVEMKPLSREAVRKVISKAELEPSPSPEQDERVFQLSAGHPLALGYLINRLRIAQTSQDYEAILSSEQPFAGQIDDVYSAHWGQLATDPALKDLLGKVARLRRVIDLNWLRTWEDPATVERMYHNVAQYFRKEEDLRWHFFHNSFRLFILQRTAESLARFDRSLDRGFHSVLAEVCASQSPDSPWLWETLYHLLNAEDHQAVVDCASQGWFRQQFLALRPAGAITTDIALAMRSAAQLQDPVAMARLTLAMAEIDGRKDAIEDVPLTQLLLCLDWVDILTDYTRDGNRLRLSEADALEVALGLYHRGYLDEARRVFELAEPLNLLRSVKSADLPLHAEVRRQLEAWAECAIFFKDVDTVIDEARQIQQEPEPHEGVDLLTASRRLQNDVLFYAARSLMDEERWGEFQRVLDQFDVMSPEDSSWWFWLHVHAWRRCLAANDQPRARTMCQKAWQAADKLDLGSHANVALAEGLYRVLDSAEEARVLIETIPEPALNDGLGNYDEDFSLFDYRFRLNRLYAGLGIEKTLSEAVPDATERRQQGMVYFERAVCRVAQIWGRSWRTTDVDVDSLIREARSVMQVFYRSWRERREWTSWYVVERARAGLLERLVDATAQYGPTAVAKLRDAFEEEWNNRGFRVYWQPDLRRRIVLALHHHGVGGRWAAAQLQALEAWLLDGLDASARVRECVEQAQAWCDIGDDDRAVEKLKKAMVVSPGVGYRKDFQMNVWTKWLAQVNSVEPAQAAERISWLARAITTLGATTEGPAQREAAEELVRVAFQWSPGAAIRLFQWLIEHESVLHEDALHSIVEGALDAFEAPLAMVLLILDGVLMPLGVGDHTKLASLAIAKVYELLGRDEATRVAQAILRAVEIHALPSSRAGWKRVIAAELGHVGIELEAIGLTPEDSEPRKDSSSDYSFLELTDGSKLTHEQVRSWVTSLPALKELLSKTEQSSYYRWRDIICELAKSLGVVELAELDAVLTGDLRSAFVLAAMSERSYEIGDENKAVLYAHEALRLSQHYGWSLWGDGGSRIAAFTALIRVDPSKGRTAMFDTLAEDGGGGASNLDRILPLLTDQVPVSEVWKEIEEYLTVQFSGVEMPADAPDLDDKDSDASAGRGIAEVVKLHMTHATTVLTQIGKRAAVQLLLSESSDMNEVIAEMLKSSEADQGVALVVLEAVAQENPARVLVHAQRIAELILSPNYDIRRSSQVISARAGLEPVPVSPLPVELPPIYAIIVQQGGGSFEFPEGIEPGKPLPDTDDPYEMVRPLTYQLSLVEEETGLPLQNLCYRTVQLMRQLVPEEQWNSEAEKRVRSILSSAGLEFSYPRPRSAVAERAVFHALAELFDSGALDLEALARLEPYLRFADPAAYLVSPERRPGCVGHISGLGDLGSKKDEWLSGLQEAAASLFATKADSRYILAEETRLRRLDWQISTEERCAVVCGPGRPKRPSDENPSSLFRRANHALVPEYPLIKLRDPKPLVVRNGLLWSDTSATDWLALNPAVGRQLGWSLAPCGLFRWTDAEGTTMVESLWWTDGLPDHRPPHFDDEVGSGWLVIASAEAAGTIAGYLGSTQRYEYARRHYTDDGVVEQASHWGIRDWLAPN